MRLRLQIFGILVVIGAGALLYLQYQTQSRLRAENVALRQQLEEASQLQAENQRLSNLVEHASAAHTEGQQSELLKLRGEVALLRKQTNELAKLRDENRRLSSATKASQSPPSSKQPPPEVPTEDIFQKESWAFAGFATPEATLQSYHWATMKGDPKALVACLSSPEEQARRLQAWEKQFEGKSESEMAAFISQRMSDVSAYRIISRNTNPDGQMEVGFYYDGRGIFRGLKFEQVGNEWKIAPGQR
jgi:hypothetical protein